MRTSADQSVLHDTRAAASLFLALSEEVRLKILLLLLEGERDVTNLCQTLRIPQPNASHHLRILRMNNLVHTRREGKHIFYSLNTEHEFLPKILDL